MITKHVLEPRSSYREGLSLLSEGHVLQASDYFGRELKEHPNNQSLLYGWMLARSRATPGNILLDELTALLQTEDFSAHWRWQFLCIKARVLKGLGTEQGLVSEKGLSLLSTSAKLYDEAYRLSKESYPGINAATLYYLLGVDDKAKAMASVIRDELLAAVDEDDFWRWATIGEAAVILGNQALARSSYEKSDNLSAGQHGDRASMRRQLQLLSSRSQVIADDVLGDLLSPPHIIVFSGHQIDAPDRKFARFPEKMLDKVSAEFTSELRSLGNCIGFCSAASGGDLLFAEALLNNLGTVNLVLPFPQHEFLETSVRPGGEKWLELFERVLAKAKRVIVANESSGPGTDQLYYYTNLLCDGLAHIHATEMGAPLHHWGLLHPRNLDFNHGGTAEEVSRWRSRGYKIHLFSPVDLSDVENDINNEINDSTVVSDQVVDDSDSNVVIRSMVFADVVGSSKIAPALLATTLVRFLDISYNLFLKEGVQPCMRNTWGDGLFLVFEKTEDAARYAVALKNTLDSDTLFLDGISVRIALHVGPVVEAHDAILGRRNAFGHHVIRAARVEPVTPPGAVFVTEEAASILEATGDIAFDYVYMGRISMPKGFGMTPIYRLEGGQRRRVGQALPVKEK